MRMHTTIPAVPTWARVGLVVAAVCCSWLLGPSAALAQTSAPQWTITAVSGPTNFAPGSSYSSGGDQYSLTVENTGGAPSDGTAITIADTLPAGVTLDPAGPTASDTEGNAVTCTSSGQTVTCTDPDGTPLHPVDEIAVTIPVDVSATSSVTNQVSVSGGGAPSASATEPTTISSSPAPFGLAAVNVVASSDQAGAHPDLTTDINLSTLSNGSSPGALDHVKVDLPVGLAGYATATPTCPAATITQATIGNAAACPAPTQVGVARVLISNFVGPGIPGNFLSPVYNLTPSPGQTAEFGFAVAGVVQTLVTSVRPGDYGLESTISNPDGSLDVAVSSVTLWGVPADPIHDQMRGAFCFGFGTTPCTGGGFFGSAGGLHSDVPAAPLLRNPTACSGVPLTATVQADSWEQQAAFVTATSQLGPFTGCGRLQFDPSISVQPARSTPDTPSGYTVVVNTPQDSNPDALATADLEKATVTLPAGAVLSPSAADGLTDCTDAQVGLGNTDPPACPDGSQIGTASLTTPALPDQLTGSIYLAGPDSGPITGPPYRIFLTLAGDGVMVKLVGTVTPDPATGQLTTTFDNNPQLPFSQLTLTFKDGARAPLTTPATCGTATTTSDLEPWSATGDATPTDSFAISGCGSTNTFAPTFTAGTTNAQAGAFSPFALTFSRSDQDQVFSGLTATLPPGVAAKLAGVPLCSDADANAGTCPASSQVGTVEAASGPGSHPFWLPGTAYLTGPYKGGPYGLAVEVPAVAGPFDLGVVVVRDAIYVDPTTAQVTVVSDPFPTIIGGIPIQLRTVNIDINRPDFMLNPTSCDPMAVTSTLSSTGGMSAPVSSRFQVGGCQELGFSPKLKLALTGKGQTRSGTHPTLTAILTQPFGQANNHSARVALPLSLALDPNNSQHVCNYDVAQAVHGGAVGCPASTIVGSATAVTPLLYQPLTGPVYLVQGLRCASGQPSQQGTCPNGQTPIRTLPSLLIPLRGQIALDLRAQTSVSGGKLVTTFPTIPDAPVSKFVLTITGGKRGILVVTGRGRSICTAKQITDANFGAQSGKTHGQNVTMGTPCGKAAHLRVLSRMVKGNGLLIRVRTSERGRLTVTGRGLRRFSRVVSRGVHRVRVGLESVAHPASVVPVHVTLTPPNAMPAKHTFRIRT